MNHRSLRHGEIPGWCLWSEGLSPHQESDHAATLLPHTPVSLEGREGETSLVLPGFQSPGAVLPWGGGGLWLDHRPLCNWIYPNGTEVMEQGLLHGPRSVRLISSKRAGCSGCVLSPFFNLAIFSLRTQGSLTP